MRQRAATRAAADGAKRPTRPLGMTRRHAVRLGALAALAGAAPWPALGAASKPVTLDSRETARASEEDADIGRVYVRAKRAGKPLLVFVVPEKVEKRAARAALFARFLEHAPDDVLADLALCEVVFRTLKELDPVVTGVGGTEPLMILIETDSMFTRFAILDAPVGNPDGSELSALVRDAVAPNLATLAHRADQARARLDTATLREVESGIEARRFGATDAAYRGAALVRLAAESDPHARAALLRPLAQAAAGRAA